MIHYDTNVTAVLNTLSSFGYGAEICSMHKECFARLKKHLAEKGIEIFPSARARQWFCEQTDYQSLPYECREAAERLCDIYEMGHISGLRIRIFTKPSHDFARLLEIYQKRIASSDYCSQYKDTIVGTARTFCQYATSMGIHSCNELSYQLLDGYDTFIHEKGGHVTNTEGRIYSFLDFLAEDGLVHPGHALYMHYTQKDNGRRTTSLSEMAEDTRAVVESHRADSLRIPADEVYRSIPRFCNALSDNRYSKSVIAVARRAVALFYLFLDREGLGYDRTIAEKWHDAFGVRVFKSDSVKAGRTLETYGDYICGGTIVFAKRWKCRECIYDSLPQWCKDRINPFLQMKEKEQWDDSTVKTYETAIVRFSLYLVSQGLASYSDLTPEMIKDFHVHDQHKTPEAKNAYRSRIAKFLEWLEEKKVLPYGMSKALPRTAGAGERIIEIMDKDDMQKIDERRKTASTPVELRDAAIIQCGLDLGFRGCDIVSLKLSDIRWKDKLIRIVQDKTDVEHWAPMSNAVGNALYRYIKDGRPKIEGEAHVFLSMTAPHGPVKMYCCKDALKRYGLSTTKFHSIRRTFGTNTLCSGATIDETANALGHTDHRNVHKYTLLDQEKMHLCCLSLEELGIPMEGRYPHA